MDKAERVFEKIAASSQLIGNAVAKRFVDIKKGLKTYDQTIDQLEKMRDLNIHGSLTAGHGAFRMRQFKQYETGIKDSEHTMPFHDKKDYEWDKKYWLDRAKNPRKSGEIK